MRIIPSKIFYENFDIAIIGGGINGAGIALDAASRGFKVVLIEKNDFGSGTTSASTKLIHGGLRYLESFELGLVRESLREREILLKCAPHLVKPLPLTIPIYEGDKRTFREIKAGLIAYDFLSYDKSLSWHKSLKTNELLEYEPSLRREEITGGAIFYDCQVIYPERLCIENMLLAEKFGAVILNYAKAVDIKLKKSKNWEITFLDTISNIKYVIKSDFIVNVSGPWVDSICQMINPDAPKKIGGTKGSHIVVKKFENGPLNALYFPSSQDSRPIFIIPWREYYLIGTTDSKYENSPDDIIAGPEEIEYLVNEVNYIIPNANLTKNDIYYSYSGIRPLPFTFDLPESSITRKHIIFDHEKNERSVRMISVIGGKLTTYRSLAKETVNLLCSKLHKRFRKIGCKTEDISLFGEFSEKNFDEIIKIHENEILKNYNVNLDIINHLLCFYGLKSYEIVDLISRYPELSLRINPDHPDIIAQIVYAVRYEHAETAIDILLRRTTIGTSKTLGLDCIEKVSEEMGKINGWNRDRITYEIDRYVHHIKTHFGIT
jgi:glycerol-3-phosphate dehydrogenase